MAPPGNIGGSGGQGGFGGEGGSGGGLGGIGGLEGLHGTGDGGIGPESGGYTGAGGGRGGSVSAQMAQAPQNKCPAPPQMACRQPMGVKVGGIRPTLVKRGWDHAFPAFTDATQSS